MGWLERDVPAASMSDLEGEAGGFEDATEKSGEGDGTEKS